MTQCIMCSHCEMKEKGNCVCLLDKKRTSKDSLHVHDCKDYKLAPMHSVKARSVRKMTFSEKNVVILK